MKNKSITVCTVLVENSPQALPLGAACIASSIKTLLSDLTIEEKVIRLIKKANNRGGNDNVSVAYLVRNEGCDD